MKDYIGYGTGRTAEVKYSETAICSGPAGPLNAQQDTGDAPLMGPPNRAAEALQVDQHKYPGDGLTGLATLWFSQRINHQATSLKPQAASFKLQATSDKLPDS